VCRCKRCASANAARFTAGRNASDSAGYDAGQIDSAAG